MYVINEYQLVALSSDVYLTNFNIGAKLPNPKLVQIISELKQFNKAQCSEEQLNELAAAHQVDVTALKRVLIEQLNILKPMLNQKIPQIYIDSDDELVSDLLFNTLNNEYQVEITSSNQAISDHSMLIFFRQNYSHHDFHGVYQRLNPNTYLVSAGVLHKLLVIDNLYLAGSGLPSHFSNLHQMMVYLNSDIPATKNNWLLFYRELVKNGLDQFPNPEINHCQRGYIAYCLSQFIAQYTNLWGAPTPMDQVNCFWQADLTNFTVHSEAALHSPFSEYDMKLNIKHLDVEEPVAL